MVGLSSSSAISPNSSPARRRATGAPCREHLDLAEQDEEQSLADLVLPDDGRPRRDVDPLEPADELHLLLVVERLEQRRGGDQVLEQPLAHEVVEPLGQHRDGGRQLGDRRTADLQQIGLVQHLDGRRARLVGHERHLAEQGPFEQAGQLDGAGRSPGDQQSARHDAHLARRDEIERRPGVPLAENQLAVTHAQEARHPHRRREQLGRQLGEEGDRQELLGVLDEHREIERAGARPGDQLGQIGGRRRGGRLDRRVEIDRRLAGGELRQRRCAVGEVARHRRHDLVDVLAERLEHLAADQRRQEVPRANIVHGDGPEDLDGACPIAELKQQVADLPAAVAVQRIGRQHLVVGGQRGGKLTGPGQVACLGLEIAKRKRHCADVIRSVKWGQRGASARRGRRSDIPSRGGGGARPPRDRTLDAGAADPRPALRRRRRARSS